MKSDLKLSRHVYIIILFIIVVAVVMQVARSEYIMGFAKNTSLLQDRPTLIKLAEQQSIVDAGEPIFLVTYDGEDMYSEMIKDNVVQTLKYMKKNTKVVNTAKEALDPKGSLVVIVTNGALDKIDNVRSLLGYVENGGYVMFSNVLEDDQTFYQFYRKLGIVSMGNMFNTQGITFTSNVLLKGKGRSFQGDYISSVTNAIEIDEYSELLAETDKGTPLMWKREYGQGSFLVYNGSILSVKASRGLIAGGISMLVPDFIYPIFNTKMLYIDDFPAPMGLGSVKVSDRYVVDNLTNFYRDIWWPDVLKAAKKYNAVYTTGLIQSYNDQVDLPFAYPPDEDRYHLMSFGREVLKSNGEIGIHGYNHQALSLDPKVSNVYGYNAWPSVGNMKLAMTEALEFLRETFSSYEVHTYIPPSNVLSPEGRQVLYDVWPQLRIIASVYMSNDIAYGQEYEISDDGIVELPRVTSGYKSDEFDQWAIANTMTSIGVFSHFIHPDDVIDDIRSSDMNWEMLYRSYEGILEDIHEAYPWMRAVTATEGASRVVDTLVSQVSWVQDTDRIEGKITNYEEGLQYVLRTERKIDSTKGCSVDRIDDNLYLVTAKSDSFEIGLGG